MDPDAIIEGLAEVIVEEQIEVTVNAAHEAETAALIAANAATEALAAAALAETIAADAAQEKLASTITEHEETETWQTSTLEELCRTLETVRGGLVLLQTRQTEMEAWRATLTPATLPGTLPELTPPTSTEPSSEETETTVKKPEDVAPADLPAPPAKRKRLL